MEVYKLYRAMIYRRRRRTTVHPEMMDAGMAEGCEKIEPSGSQPQKELDVT